LVHNSLKEYEKAIDFINSASRFQSLDYDNYKLKGSALIKLNLHKEAKENIENALSLTLDFSQKQDCKSLIEKLNKLIKEQK